MVPFGPSRNLRVDICNISHTDLQWWTVFTAFAFSKEGMPRAVETALRSRGGVEPNPLYDKDWNVCYNIGTNLHEWSRRSKCIFKWTCFHHLLPHNGGPSDLVHRFHLRLAPSIRAQDQLQENSGWHIWLPLASMVLNPILTSYTNWMKTGIYGLSCSCTSKMYYTCTGIVALHFRSFWRLLHWWQYETLPMVIDSPEPFVHMEGVCATWNEVVIPSTTDCLHFPVGAAR